MIDDIMNSEPFRKSRGQRPEYYDHVIKQIELDGLWLEFGTFVGLTAKQIIESAKKAGNKNIRLYGFDSFLGLPEQWVENDKKTWSKGAFKAPRKPQEQKEFLEKKYPQLTCVVGMFQNTLEPFLQDHKDDIALLHIDCDLYVSSSYVLRTCRDRIVDGTVILFDEIHGYDNYEEHEYKAFSEFLRNSNLYPEWIAHVSNAAQGACIMREKNDTARSS